MAKALNFNNVKKKFLTVTLADDNNTTLLIGLPKKAVIDELLTLRSNLQTVQEDLEDHEALNDLYKTCAKVMSVNKNKITITQKYLEELFDFEDIMIFLEAYTDFIEEVSGSKNSKSPTTL